MAAWRQSSRKRLPVPQALAESPGGAGRRACGPGVHLLIQEGDRGCGGIGLPWACGLCWCNNQLQVTLELRAAVAGTSPQAETGMQVWRRCSPVLPNAGAWLLPPPFSPEVNNVWSPSDYRDVEGSFLQVGSWECPRQRSCKARLVSGLLGANSKQDWSLLTPMGNF